MRCTVADVKTALTELRTGQQLTGTHHETFAMRARAGRGRRQDASPTSTRSGRRTCTPSRASSGTRRCGSARPSPPTSSRRSSAPSACSSSPSSPPSRTPGRRTSSPTSTSTAGSTSRATRAATRRRSTASKPLVYFGSFQDLLGRDTAGNIKAKNEWLHTINWDLVVFDEYHFGAWRETAKELFEGEDDAVAKKETQARVRRRPGDGQRGPRASCRENETEFLPITTRAYLYLSGTPFRALATGEFIEEQIFNWTYTDEQRAKEEFAAEHPGEWNPYGALPQMRLLTYQMPDELLAIASAGRVRRVRPQRVLRGHGHGRAARVQAQERRPEVARHHPRRLRARRRSTT